MLNISQSVSSGGINNTADIQVIEKSLNRNGHLLLSLPVLPIDGMSDDATFPAIINIK